MFTEGILEKNRMSGSHLRGEEPEGWNDLHVNAVEDGYQSRCLQGVDFLDRRRISWVDGPDPTFLDDYLGLKVTQFVELVGEGFPFVPAGKHPEYLVST